MMNVFDYLRTWKAMKESAYPYTGTYGRCAYDGT